MILNEIRKTFGKKTFLILLCVMILNGVLLISGESDKGYNFTGEDYRKLYSSEDMQKDTETQLAYLNACLEENGMSRQYTEKILKRLKNKGIEGARFEIYTFFTPLETRKPKRKTIPIEKS